MAVFKVEIKNKVDIDKKPRVYFTCHPDDFGRYFKKVCDDIFKTHDCAIYYTEDMSEVIADDEKQVDLGRNNLFVIPVTFKLLTTPNRAMDEDIPYALKEHIPVLPIMMEPGIDEIYSKPDKFGELQYLNPYSTDLTEISYEEKLKKYLESVLISDELAKRVRAAFDAYIFLSYRKKDRKYANELMRLIHSNPECRDIAIWFDEFLTPGESFKENIEKILDECKLFTLLVTPQLLEKVVDENGEERDNYVISTELPLARKKKQEKGTDIFAVEMEETDKEALLTINIDDYVNFEDSEFRARLLETISRIAITTNNTPEHNFLIGLAYLEGIDVEVDYERSIGLITSAAKAELPEALEKLVWMYNNGTGVKKDRDEAIIWHRRLVNYYATQYEYDNCMRNTKRYLNVLWDFGDALCPERRAISLFSIKYIDEANAIFTKMSTIAQKHNCMYELSISYKRLGNIEETWNENKEKAREYYKESLKIDELLLQTNTTIGTLQSFASGCYNIGMIEEDDGNIIEAKNWFLKAFTIMTKLVEKKQSINFYRSLLAYCISLEIIAKKEENLVDERRYLEKELEIRKIIIDSDECSATDRRDFLRAIDGFGYFCKKQGNFIEARKYFEKAIKKAILYSNKYCDPLFADQVLFILCYNWKENGVPKELIEEAVYMCENLVEKRRAFAFVRDKIKKLLE